MQTPLIQGEFNSNEILDLFTQMIASNIKYQENKIAVGSNEEDVKRREAKIIKIQKSLYELKSRIRENKGVINLEATIKIN
jgi:hypothetical protein